MKRIMLMAALVAAPVAAQDAPVPAGLTVDRVVLLMRHGVRPPTKAPPMPAGTADRPWPAWPVAPGYLTPHGRTAIARVAAYDRARWSAAGLVAKTGCTPVRLVADSDERTIETARAYAGAFQPGCTPVIEHRPQDEPDPLFSPIDEQAVAFDPAAAQAAVLAAAGPGGIAGEEARVRPLLTRLDTILCGKPQAGCGIGGEPSGLAPARPGKRPKLSGALDRASTAAQILLLEYAEGKPMTDVGWGRATPADIAALAELHALEFRLLARPAYVARANLSLLAPLIADSLTKPNGARVTMISGHDTNVAAMGGLLDLHWQVPGLSRDDPSPGGAIVFERLRDAAGKGYVRALFRSQSIAQIRNLTPLTAGATPYVAVLAIPGCSARGIAGLCTAEAFAARLSQKP
ncbi:MULTISPECIES: histidine-type phosphatase [unclassified Sphingomonas]|jgi:4-phytase / acid phosphatase|uniref:histidine-type phosphatase n=1 Tax=unclassified Sphingomonas TaxID=196159 RepID=UPI000E107D77|nr:MULTISPECIES: histidine-type phosphatase [unclassified Sphingomonas]AXJ96684.1 histidine-type phosphatase [Sphingomonas sp. FARSPH]